MPLHFGKDELALRRRRVCAALQEQGLDGLLMFRQESMYYLTGYDTFGYVFFQCLYMSADGSTITLLTRAPDLRQARYTSIIDDIRIWRDRDGANPALELKEILEEQGCRGKRLGVEYDAYGLTGQNCKRLEAALDGFCELEDSSYLVSRLRLTKSTAEIAFVRKAAELADLAYAAVLPLIRPGVSESDILATLHATIYKGGGDDPANEFCIGSGPGALLGRYQSYRRILEPDDQITLEWAGVYRHYHAAMMRTLVAGRAPQVQRDMQAVALEAIAECEEALRPGNMVGQVFDAYARTCDRAGMTRHRLNACGYCLGATFGPNWMDWPMLYAKNPVLLEPGMVFFVIANIFNSDAGLAVAPARTYVVTETGNEPLSNAPFHLEVG
ncbi:MAG: Xaa-Pro peptidase family protein [Hyphomicrobiaceae bacterium]